MLRFLVLMPLVAGSAIAVGVGVRAEVHRKDCQSAILRMLSPIGLEVAVLSSAALGATILALLA